MADQTFPSIIVFDVNETLLDITTLEPLFERLFADRKVLREWFTQLILYSQSMTLSGLYTPFGELAVGTLRMLATLHQVTLNASDSNELKERMSNMPAHPDVVPALSQLQDARFRLVTLSNSPSSASPSPLGKAGLSHFFEHSFSVDATGKFKPAAETYQLVAQNLSVATSELCLVTCHLWDTIGAQAAGCRGAFLTRSGNAMLPASNVPVPDLIASTLTELANQIILQRHSS